MASVTANIDLDYKLPECEFTAPSGKTFKNWLVGSAEYNAGAIVQPYENTTVKANWQGSGSSTEITWDGDTTGKTSFTIDGDTYYLVSSLTPTINDILPTATTGTSYKLSNEEYTGFITSEHLLSTTDYCYIKGVLYLAEFEYINIIIVYNSCSIKGVTISTPGTYFIKYDSDYVEALSWNINRGTLKTITWDGNTTGKTIFDMGDFIACKMNDDMPVIQDIMGCSVICVVDGTPTTYIVPPDSDIIGNYNNFIMAAVWCISCYSEDPSVPGLTPGFWLVKEAIGENPNYVSSFSYYTK